MSQINKHRSPWQVPIGDCDSKTCRKTATTILKQLQKEKLNVQRQRHGKKAAKKQKRQNSHKETQIIHRYILKNK